MPRDRSTMPADAAAVDAGLPASLAPRLLGFAYRMLGTTAEAEDAVAETTARWVAADREAIENPEAWCTAVLSRVCVDRLRSAQRRREVYVGPWLPEPLVHDPAAPDDPADLLVRSESLTIALLVVLDELTPLQRAVFLLRDVFGHAPDEIAAALDRSPEAVRAAAARARRAVEARRPDPATGSDEAERVTTAFLAACETGDLEGVLGLLAPDVVFVSDGGGRAAAVPVPVVGAAEVARLCVALARTGQRRGATVRRAAVNGAPGVVVEEHGAVVSVLALDVVGDRLRAIHVVRNPEKLPQAPAPRPGQTGPEP